MLVLLPASDKQNLVDDGPRFDPSLLSFPSLEATRAEVLAALVEVSKAPDSLRRLQVPPTLAGLVERNARLARAAAAPAAQIYAGVLYRALDLAGIDSASRRRARSRVVVISSLWGALRLSDHIPSYRLDMCARLPGLDHLTKVWREPLDGVLPDAVGRGLVVDFRSGEFATTWRPEGALAERSVIIKIDRDPSGERGASSHAAKATRGLVARHLVSVPDGPTRPEELAELLASEFVVRLHGPDKPGVSPELHVVDPLSA